MSDKTSPTDIEALNEKIEKNEVKIGKVAQKRSPHPKKERKTNNKAPSDKHFLEALRKLAKQGRTPCTSRVLSDALGIENADFGRGAARAAMRRLTKEGSVITETKQEGKVKFHYSPASPKQA